MSSGTQAREPKIVRTCTRSDPLHPGRCRPPGAPAAHLLRGEARADRALPGLAAGETMIRSRAPHGPGRLAAPAPMRIGAGGRKAAWPPWRARM